MKSKKQRIYIVIGLAVVIAACAIPLIVSFQSQSKKTDSKPDSPNLSNLQNYEERVRRIAPTNVLAGMVPVHIWRNSNACCLTGTLIIPTNGAVPVILTAAHAFLTNRLAGPAYFEYQILQPFEQEFHPIGRIQTDVVRESDDPKKILDVALCYPGRSTLIDPVPDTEKYSASISGKITSFDFALFKDTYDVQSLVSGDVVKVIGRAKSKNGQLFYVLRYESIIQGESGTAFVRDRELYVLSSMLETTPQARRFFKLPADTARLALASRITMLMPGGKN